MGIVCDMCPCIPLFRQDIILCRKCFKQDLNICFSNGDLFGETQSSNLKQETILKVIYMCWNHLS
jgi:hypothetical protein